MNLPQLTTEQIDEALKGTKYDRAMVVWHQECLDDAVQNAARAILLARENERLRAQLAERDAQLAAERTMSAKLYECLSDVSYEASPNIYGDVEMFDGTKMQKFINESGIVPYQEHLTTRQQPQGKNGE